MQNVWQLQDAKNRLSEVVEEALHKGPQMVRRRGKDTVVILSITDYNKLRRPKSTLVEFMKRSPLRGVRLDLKRNKEFGRDVNL